MKPALFDQLFNNNLVMAIDEHGKGFHGKPFNLQVPLRTRLHFLKKSNTLQEETLQDKCPHANFEKGACDECEYRCTHEEIEESHCLDCGEFQKPQFDDDFYFDQWKETRHGF